MAKRKKPKTIKEPMINVGKLISIRKFNMIIKLFETHKNLSTALEQTGVSRTLFEKVIEHNNTFREKYEDALRSQMSMITEKFVSKATEEGDSKSAVTALKILNDEMARLSNVDDGFLVIEFNFPPPQGTETQE